MDFELLPAIDVRAGRVVRLLRGDFDAETVYGDEPAAVAARFVAAGAPWLHVVDLDGARGGEQVNRDAIDRISHASRGTGTRLEVAGGIRSAGAVADLLDHAADRVVLGSAALADADLVRDLVERHGSDAVAVALDVRAGRAIGHGWSVASAGVPVLEALARLRAAGVTTFEVTAIDRDGTFEGPDLPLLERCVRSGGSGVAIVASAGIATIEDIRRVRDLGCRGAIVGRAIYEGRLTIEEALGAAGGASEP